MQSLKQQILARDRLITQQLIHQFRLAGIRVADYRDSRSLRNLVISLCPQKFLLFQLPFDYFVQFYVFGLKESSLDFELAFPFSLHLVTAFTLFVADCF
jgi:hypothetical protein